MKAREHGACTCAFIFTLSLRSYDTKVETKSKQENGNAGKSRKVTMW